MSLLVSNFWLFTYHLSYPPKHCQNSASLRVPYCQLFCCRGGCRPEGKRHHKIQQNGEYQRLSCVFDHAFSQQIPPNHTMQAPQHCQYYSHDPRRHRPVTLLLDTWHKTLQNLIPALKKKWIATAPNSKQCPSVSLVLLLQIMRGTPASSAMLHPTHDEPGLGG